MEILGKVLKGLEEVSGSIPGRHKARYHVFSSSLCLSQGSSRRASARRGDIFVLVVEGSRVLRAADAALLDSCD